MINIAAVVLAFLYLVAGEQADSLLLAVSI